MRLPCSHSVALPGRPRCAFVLGALLSMALSGGSPRPAYPASPVASIRGFAAQAAVRTLQQEARLRSAIDADALAATAQELGRRPAIAGTESMRHASRWLAQRLASWGLRTEVHRYEVFMPQARRVALERIHPRPLSLRLDEQQLAQDPDTRVADYPAAAGYSAAGDVSAPVVYANYGRAEDFAVLRALGVPVRHRVVLIRYGRLFRGAKVENAQNAGAAAVILYSDPADDGYRQGTVYPDGPFRPPSGIQRGSVKIGPPGDPSTPGWASLPGARRIAPEVPQIPVVMAGYAAADELLRYLEGPTAPAGWQGGLARTYRTGRGAVSVRVLVELESQTMRSIYDTLAFLEGSSRPDEWVIVGAHRDSWSNGAVDNVSGTASVLQAARALAAMASRGERPRRTVVFAFWDAEEWGLIGSAEWVEEHEETLREGAVAYINQDGVAGGPYFAGVASPSLRRLLLEVAGHVPDPVDPAHSVLDGWRRRSPEAVVPPPAGGSDYASFTGRVGVPSMGFGFTGGAGVYHSAYDTRTFMQRFGDPGYRQHQAASRLVAVLAWRLANADLLPTRLADLATDLDSRARTAARRLQQYRLIDAVQAQQLLATVRRFLLASQRFQLHADQRLQQGTAGAGELRRLNDAVRTAWTRLAPVIDATPRGWFRNRLLAADLADSYQARWFPRLATAANARDRGLVDEALGDLLGPLEQAAAALDAVAIAAAAAPASS